MTQLLGGSTSRRALRSTTTPVAVHHTKSIFEDPHLFRPERFLDDQETNSEEKNCLENCLEIQFWFCDMCKLLTFPHFPSVGKLKIIFKTIFKIIFKKIFSFGIGLLAVGVRTVESSRTWLRTTNMIEKKKLGIGRIRKAKTPPFTLPAAELYW